MVLYLVFDLELLGDQHVYDASVDLCVWLFIKHYWIYAVKRVHLRNLVTGRCSATFSLHNCESPRTAPSRCGILAHIDLDGIFLFWRCLGYSRGTLAILLLGNDTNLLCQKVHLVFSAIPGLIFLKKLCKMFAIKLVQGLNKELVVEAILSLNVCVEAMWTNRSLLQNVALTAHELDRILGMTTSVGVRAVRVFVLHHIPRAPTTAS